LDWEQPVIQTGSIGLFIYVVTNVIRLLAAF